MAEKVKVSREVAKVLDEIRACHEPTIDDFIKCHAIGDVGRDWRILNQFRTLFVSHLIYTGDYEIEETPEEKLLAYYNDLAYQYTSTGERVHTGYAPGKEYVEKTLKILGIEIKGINK